MLTWFPTPYPDETFYSVLCRYYVSAGIKEHALVKRQLFGNREGIKMATLYPNAAIHMVLSELPKGLFDERDMILRHTPFLYYTRMYPAEERGALLEELTQGKGKTPTHLWRTFPKDGYAMRYCPCCVREDTQAFGEPYYHVEHQIPLSSVCVRHRCRLRQITVRNPRLSMNSSFFPLGTMELEQEADMDVTASERRISQIIYEYWKLPLSVSPPAGVNGFYQTLLNGGYMEICRQTGVAVDKKKLYDGLCAYHGENMTEKIFGAGINTSMMNRIGSWEQLLPDRYIMIQAVLDLPTRTVFGQEAVVDKLKQRIDRMAEKGGFCTLKQVAAKLKRKPYEVNAILRFYGMEPFWREMPKGKSRTPRKGLLRCTVDEEELARIVQCSKELGYRCEGAFALDCVRYVMEQAGRKSRNV